VFRIAEPGSYYLTGDVLGESGNNGIELAASAVTIDLMGFQVIGGEGSLQGIVVTEADVEAITLRNGTIRGWGQSGVFLVGVEGGLLEGLVAEGNALDGINGPSHAAVRHCVGRNNGNSGIDLGAWSSASHCTAEGNGFIGISVDLGSRAVDCQASGNQRGISLFTSAQATRCTATGNSVEGFRVEAAGMLLDCVSNANTFYGITVTGSAAVVRGNLCRDNGDGLNGAGIRLIDPIIGCRIEGNTVTENHMGIQAEGTHNMIVRNTAQGNGTDFSLNSNNTIGQIIDFSADGQHVLDENNAGAWDNIRH
jgi:parallel beta-helix repeat protein